MTILNKYLHSNRNQVNKLVTEDKQEQTIVKNDRKVRLVVKKYNNLNKYLHSNGNQITMDENVYKC